MTISLEKINRRYLVVSVEKKVVLWYKIKYNYYNLLGGKDGYRIKKQNR